MFEWLKKHAWKACVLQKGTTGSNPVLSAKTTTKKPCKSLQGFFLIQFYAYDFLTSFLPCRPFLVRPLE